MLEFEASCRKYVSLPCDMAIRAQHVTSDIWTTLQSTVRGKGLARSTAHGVLAETAASRRSALPDVRLCEVLRLVICSPQSWLRPQELCAVQEERSSRREASTVNLHEIVNLNAASLPPASQVGCPQRRECPAKVGGKVYTVKRETLCVCRGSFLAELFSGRWDPKLQKDAAGHFFLDVDPDVFDIILATRIPL